VNLSNHSRGSEFDINAKQTGWSSCRRSSGREVAKIDTEAPWGVEALEGTKRFHVFADQLVIRRIAD
jgi:hypothetical protein